MKKILSCFIILVLIFSVGCSSQNVKKEAKTVVDQAGNSVKLPGEINRVVIISPWPLASVYTLYMGSGDKLVGVHPAVKSAAEYSQLTKVAPNIDKVNSDFVKGENINVESLLALKPDVIFYSATDKTQQELIKKINIPAVGFSVSSQKFNTVETTNSWIELLGKIFDDEDKAKGITDYARNTEKMIKDRLAKVDQKDYKKALIIYQYNNKNFVVGGKNFFGQYWCDAVGLKCVSDTITERSATVNMEQIYNWNPDVIFVTNFVPYLSEDFYNNKIENYDFSSLNAIKAKQVYKFPLGMYRWFPPSSDSALTLLWLAKIAHPDLFKDIDLDKEIKDYYKKFYNVTLSDDDLNKIYNPTREAAKGSY